MKKIIFILVGLSLVAVGIFFIAPVGSVKKGEIAFVALPDKYVAYDEAVEFVDVRKLDINIHSQSYWFFNRSLWKLFANNPHERSFAGISTENWFQKWSFFKSKLIERANASGLNAQSLQLSLNKIEPKETDHKALLPIAAYACKNGRSDIWIIVCKWEYANPRAEKDGKKIFHGMGHVAIWALNASSQRVYGYAQCR